MCVPVKWLKRRRVSSLQVFVVAMASRAPGPSGGPSASDARSPEFPVDGGLASGAWMPAFHSWAVVTGAVFLGCTSGPQPLRSDAWGTRDAQTPLDCSAFAATGAAARVGDPVEPGPGTGVRQPSELGAGRFRQVWTSTLGSARLEWVAPAGEEVRTLWLLRIAEGGRCVVGTWQSPGLPMVVVKHAFTPGGGQEVVLLGLGEPPRRGWMALVSDGANLWSALDSRNPRPGAILGEQAELVEKDSRLLLVMVDQGRTGVLDFDGLRFRTRP